jgi:hypothetical protein
VSQFIVPKTTAPDGDASSNQTVSGGSGDGDGTVPSKQLPVGVAVIDAVTLTPP